MNTDISYHDLYDKLSKLLRSLESDSVSIDDLSHNLEDAYKLISQLRERLTSVEAKVEEIISTRQEKGV